MWNVVIQQQQQQSANFWTKFLFQFFEGCSGHSDTFLKLGHFFRLADELTFKYLDAVEWI